MSTVALLRDLADVLHKHEASLYMGENDETVFLAVHGQHLEMWEMELKGDSCRLVPVSEDAITWQRDEGDEPFWPWAEFEGLFPPSKNDKEEEEG